MSLRETLEAAKLMPTTRLIETMLTSAVVLRQRALGNDVAGAAALAAFGASQTLWTQMLDVKADVIVTECNAAGVEP